MSADFLTKTERSSLMRRIRSSNTGPELELAVALRATGVFFETNCADVPGKPDIVVRSNKLAVFVDGEFWHGGQWRGRGLNSLAHQFPDPTKRTRWMAKIQGNQTRDFARTAQLLAEGWTVIRFWAGDVEKDPAAAANLVIGALSKNIPVSPASYLPQRYVGEFFAGIGLARLGLKPDGWTVQFANDNAPDKILFYKENVEKQQAYLDERDIHEIAVKDIPPVALATACFPCTDLSLAGAQRGLERGTKSSAYLKFTELLFEMGQRRPPLVLLENVLGMISSREGVDFTICLEQLQKAGYLVDAFVLDAKWFVPQSRPRLFIVGIRSDLNPLGHVGSDRLTDVATLRPARLAQFIRSHPDLPWSLRNLPSPDVSPIRLSHNRLLFREPTLELTLRKQFGEIGRLHPKYVIGQVELVYYTVKPAEATWPIRCGSNSKPRLFGVEI